MAQNLAAFYKKMDRLEKEFNGSAARARIEHIAMETKKDVDEAVRNDLGDQSMSGWRRGSPFDITGMFTIHGGSSFEVTPTRKGRGPMRVLESGRQAYGIGDKRRSGSYTSKKTGATKDRYRKIKRNVGATRGKNTWSDAVRLMHKRVPGRVDVQLVKDLGRIFGKG